MKKVALVKNWTLPDVNEADDKERNIELNTIGEFVAAPEVGKPFVVKQGETEVATTPVISIVNDMVFETEFSQFGWETWEETPEQSVEPTGDNVQR